VKKGSSIVKLKICWLVSKKKGQMQENFEVAKEKKTTSATLVFRPVRHLVSLRHCAEVTIC